MATKQGALIFLLIGMTSSLPRDGDLLQSACSEACRDWEDWRKQCFNTHCVVYMMNGEDWFPCFLSCWDKARACVAKCADTFWYMYSGCSRQCLRRTGRKRRQCRHACIVNRFLRVKKLLVPPLPATETKKIDRPHNMYM